MAGDRPRFNVGISRRFQLVFSILCLLFSPSLVAGIIVVLVLFVISPIGLIVKMTRSSRAMFGLLQMVFIVGFGAEIVADSVFILYGLIDIEKGSNWMFFLLRLGVYIISIFTSYGIGTIWKKFVVCKDSNFYIQEVFYVDNVIWEDALVAFVIGLVYRAMLLLQALKVFFLWLKSTCSGKSISLRAFDEDQDKGLSVPMTVLAADFIFCSFPMAIIAAYQYTISVPFPPNITWIAVKFIGFSLSLIGFSYFIFIEQFNFYKNSCKDVFTFERRSKGDDAEFYKNMNERINLASPKK